MANAEAWLRSSKAKQRIAAAKAHAISEFKKRFPRANISRFKVQVDLDQNRKATGKVFFSRERWFMDGPTNKRPQILVTRSEGCFGYAPRWWVSCSAIAPYRK